MAHVIWAPAALDDADAIAAFIARDSPGAASLLVERFIEAVDRLTEFPELGRVVPEVGDPALRELIVSPYRIMYRVEGGAVWITAIVHGARDWTP